MANTTKGFSEYDANQIHQKTYNEEGGTVAVDGFLVGKVGRKITLAISTTTITNDTETYSYSESGTALFTLTIIYVSGAREVMLSSERTA